ncbi:hypothetical protein TWF694_003650 [Orbilia ellipsospora]|uniref:Uncharacterized protein n=1 Tax=Orbilia ellipsospora TaxID=2528407 RepID=A0AAV9WYU8_9PEZI
MDSRQLWFVRYISRNHDIQGHPDRFDHWFFYLPEEPVHDQTGLGAGRVLEAAGHPITGFSQNVNDTDISKEDAPRSADLLMKSIDFEKVTEKARKQPGFPRSEHPETGKPNCQAWLYLLAVACVEDGIMDDSVVKFLVNSKQE